MHIFLPGIASEDLLIPAAALVTEVAVPAGDFSVVSGAGVFDKLKLRLRRVTKLDRLKLDLDPAAATVSSELIYTTYRHTYEEYKIQES